MRRSIPTALAILAAGLALSLAPVAAQGPIFGTITGPSALAPSQVSAYNLTINGGPTGAVTYTVRWYLTGPSVAGGLPNAATPMTTSGNRTTFTLNVTAPTAEQTITLVVQISSVVGSTYENTTAEKSIAVILRPSPEPPTHCFALFGTGASPLRIGARLRFSFQRALQRAAERPCLCIAGRPPMPSSGSFRPDFPLLFVRCTVSCCGAVAPGVTAALLGRFLPRLGPLAVASGPFLSAS